MLDVLAANPLLTVTLVLALGTLVGQIPFGPVRFGPAGALFVGLAVGALDARLGEGLSLVQSLGLALFVYTVGVAAGASFFRNLRKQLPLMACAVIALVATTLVAMAGGRLLGLSSALSAGAFAGALTSTPALAAAAELVGTEEPAVGYSISYPVGVLVTIPVVAVILSLKWPARNDSAPAAGVGLVDISVEVSRPGTLQEVPGFADGSVLFSYLRRNGETRVVSANEALQVGDRVVMVGPAEAVRRARTHLGHRVDEHLAHDRSEVDYRRFIVSNREAAGRTVAGLDFDDRFGGVITRVRRGDLDLLARDDLTLELGDRVRVVVPRGQLAAVGEFLGDSERSISEVDAFSLGIGLALGLAVGLISIPLPGGITLALGSAAGPLVVGMVLGRLERTGPLVLGTARSSQSDDPPARSAAVPRHDRTGGRPSLRQPGVHLRRLAYGHSGCGHRRDWWCPARPARARDRHQPATNRGRTGGLRRPTRDPGVRQLPLDRRAHRCRLCRPVRHRHHRQDRPGTGDCRIGRQHKRPRPLTAHPGVSHPDPDQPARGSARQLSGSRRQVSSIAPGSSNRPTLGPANSNTLAST